MNTEVDTGNSDKQRQRDKDYFKYETPFRSGNYKQQTKQQADIKGHIVLRVAAWEARLIGKHHLKFGTGTVQNIFEGYVYNSGNYNRNCNRQSNGEEILSSYCGYNENKYGYYYNAYGASQLGYSSEGDVHSGSKLSKQIENSSFESAYTFSKGNTESEAEGNK